MAVQVGIHLLLLSLSLVGISPSSWYQLTHCFNTVVEIRLAPEQCLPLQADTGVDMLCRPRSIIPGISTTQRPSRVQEWMASLRRWGAKCICIFLKGPKVTTTRWGPKTLFSFNPWLLSVIYLRSPSHYVKDGTELLLILFTYFLFPFSNHCVPKPTIESKLLKLGSTNSMLEVSHIPISLANYKCKPFKLGSTKLRVRCFFW